MEIRWTIEASANLEHICLHIAKDKPEAARKTVALIFARI
jgi:plasmid stabilization system protein ParE